jgi:hypothetical protein
METAAAASDFTWLYWLIAGLAVLVLIVLAVIAGKGRRMPGEHVFKASRWSRGNRLLPAQVGITRDSITLFQPQWIGKIEESIHISHISSIKIDTNLIFSDVLIETTGGHHPIVCHGHTKGDAVRMKKIIEQYQSERFGRGAEDANSAIATKKPV